MMQREWVRYTIGLFLAMAGLVSPVGAMEEAAAEQVIRLVAEGKDQAAIALYEQENTQEDAPLEVLRAVAGSYWRLRRFETARDLYRDIMRRQPALATMIGPSASPENASAAQVASGADTADLQEDGAPEPAVEYGPVEQVASGEPPAGLAADQAPAGTVVTEAVAASGADDVQTQEETDIPEKGGAQTEEDDAPKGVPSPPGAAGQEEQPVPEMQAEVDALHALYMELEAERENQRQNLEKRILTIMRHTEQTLGEMESIRAERDQMERALSEADGRSTSLADEMSRKEEQWTEERQNLEQDVTRLRNAYQELESESAARMADLASALKGAQAERAQAAQRVEQLTESLAAQTATAAERKTALQVMKAEMETRKDQALADQARWQERLTELEEQLDTERVAARARRDAFAEREAKLKEDLAARTQEQEERTAQLERAQREITASSERIAALEAARDTLTNRLAAVKQAKVAQEATMQEELEEHQRLHEKAQQTVTQLLEQAEAEAKARDALANQLAAERKKQQEQQQAFREIQDRLVKAVRAEQARTADVRAKLDALQAERAAERKAAEERRLAVEAEQAELESALQDLQARMTALVELAEAQERDTARKQELARARESELEAQLEAALAAKETAFQQAETLAAELHAALEAQAEENARLEAGQKELEEQLAARDLAVTQLQQRLADDVQGQVLDVALREIEMLEQEYRDMERKWQQEQAELLGQLAALRAASDASSQEKTLLEDALAAATARQSELEGALEEQKKDLARAHATIDEATTALARQYDALRQQMATGVSIPIPDDGADPAALSPLILELAEATETVNLESENLRKQFEKEHKRLQDRLEDVLAERDALAHEMAERERLRSADVARLEQRLSAVQAELASTEGQVQQLQEALEAERTADAEQAADVPAPGANRDGAIPTAGRMAEEPPTPRPAEKGLEDHALLQAMQRMVQDNDVEGAIALFEARDPDAMMPLAVFQQTGECYRMLGRHEQAYAVFQDMLARDPGNVQAEQGIVMSLFDMGEYDKALQYLSDYGTSGDAEGKQ